MSTSYFVCWRDGLPVHDVRGGWRHSLGGQTGAILAHRRHYPVPIERALYEEAYSVSVTPERFAEIKAMADATEARLHAELIRKGRRLS